MTQTAPFGSWKSPITSDLIVSQFINLGQIQLDGNTLYWSEGRPAEKGRAVVVRQAADGSVQDVLPAPFYARSRVHEYGGAAWFVDAGVLYFAHFADQRVYRMADTRLTDTRLADRQPQAITPTRDLRYADFRMDAARQRLVTVREDHTDPSGEVINTLCALDPTGADVESGGTVLASGCDFYASPRISPDGAHLAWLSWNHPNMPWDGTTLSLADFAPDGSLTNITQLAGGVAESIFQPEWSPDGVLYFISDRTGWWNLYRWQEGVAQPLHPAAADFGEPQWVFGMTTYGFAADHRLVCSYYAHGEQRLAVLDTHTLQFTPLALPFNEFAGLQTTADAAWLIAASPTEPTALIRVNIHTGAYQVIKRTAEINLDPRFISLPQEVEYPAANGLTGYAFYYPPHNPDFTAPAGELPPLIVISHGGPTSIAKAGLDLHIQYWTSRGLGVVDVNYGGSTGFGRAYRERLRGQWGVVDVDDCVNAALTLAKSGLADPQRLAIRGGSAGGYTTLAALTFRRVFQVGVSYYGISDMEALAKDTHKFESRYTDSMVGPYPAMRDLYIQRSPIHFTNQLECALLLLQGSEDRVVPPDQSRQMYESVRAKGLPVAYLEFAGEQHGFRQAQNIQRALDGELYFYGKVFGFHPADALAPIPIENLAA